MGWGVLPSDSVPAVRAAGGFGLLQGAVLDAPVLPVQSPLCLKEQKDMKSSVLSLHCGLCQRFPPALA